MVTLKDIPDMYKAGAVLVILVIGGMTYHDKFAIAEDVSKQYQTMQVQMVEQQVATTNQIQYMLVLSMEDKKELKINAKAKAVADNNTVDAEKLEQEIQTLRDRIKGLCDQLDDC